MAKELLLNVENISKEFPVVQALDNVDFDLQIGMR